MDLPLCLGVRPPALHCVFRWSEKSKRRGCVPSSIRVVLQELKSVQTTLGNNSSHINFQVRHPRSVEYKLQYNIKYTHNTVIHKFIFY